MNGIFVLRYVYKRRLSYLTALFIITASFSCGIFSGKGNDFCDNDVITMLTERLLPIALIWLGGLFFAGGVLSFAGGAFFAYRLGYIAGCTASLLFAQRTAFLFLYGIPVFTVMLLSAVFSLAESFNCNEARFLRRRKGVCRMMTQNELYPYIRKALASMLLVAGMVSAEKYVFCSAFMMIISR